MTRKIVICAAALIVLAGGWFAYKKFNELRSPEQKMAYALGAQVGVNLARQGVPVDPHALSLAIKDVLTNSKVRLSEEELNQSLQAYQVAAQKLIAESAEKNKKEGDAFLRTNSLRKEVSSLPNGLQYERLKDGKGKKIQAKDTVVANYRGTLINGTEFDSSARMGKPAELKVSNLIPGLQAGLPLMEVGSVFRFFVPPELAYQNQGRPGIPPNSTLIFEIEAVSLAGAEKKKDR